MGTVVIMGNLRSWSCKGCLNTELRITPQGEIAEYCSLYKNGKKPRHVWVTEDFIDCLDKRIKNE